LLKREFRHLLGVDEIHISSYPATSIPCDDDLRSIAAELAVPITIQVFHHFRWHRSPPQEDGKLTERIFATCQLYHTWQCHTLRDGWFYPCPTAATWGSRNKEGADLLAAGLDHKAEIARLLCSQVPLASCKRCLGSVGQRFEHRLCQRGYEHGLLPRSDPDFGFLTFLELDAAAHNGCFAYDRRILPSGHVLQCSDGS
jgi:hypothetical protein